MQRIKAISLVLLGVLLSIFGTHIFEVQDNLDLSVVDEKISGDVFLVGYRNNNSGATDGFSYNYYLTSDKKILKQPFLVTNNPDIKFTIYDKENISIKVKGKVYQFHNNVWVDANGKLKRVKIEFTAVE